jgi:hypothetical protein
LNAKLAKIIRIRSKSSMAKKKRKKTTPEEWARWEANEKRLYELANRGLEKLGMTREELHRKLGLPPP